MSSLPPRCSVPVLLLVHRRAELAPRLLNVLRDVRPESIFLAADGPGEDAGCIATREAYLRGIDWPCDVQTRFLAERAGCRRAVSGAIDWAFELSDQVIILEEDCLPDPSFFPFCEEMLDRFQNENRVMQVCGSNLAGCIPTEGSYYFSRFGPIWGWATWRRAWQHYDVEMRSWPEFFQSARLRKLCPERFEAQWRSRVFKSVHKGLVDTWDYQWAFAKLRTGGVNVVPAINLVSNVGFGKGATHTINATDPRAAMATESMEFPLQHSAKVEPWEKADREYLQRVVGLPRSFLSLAALRFLVQGLR